MREDLERLAREAGFAEHSVGAITPGEPDRFYFTVWPAQLERFAQLVEQKVRDECREGTPTAQGFMTPPQCHCGQPSHILWRGQGFCCDEHLRTAIDRAAAIRSAPSEAEGEAK